MSRKYFLGLLYATGSTTAAAFFRQLNRDGVNFFSAGRETARAVGGATTAVGSIATAVAQGSERFPDGIQTAVGLAIFMAVYFSFLKGCKRGGGAGGGGVGGGGASGGRGDPDVPKDK